MKANELSAELIINVKYPLRLLKGEYLISSAIRTGYLILGAGYMSLSAYFVDPDHISKFRDIIDFENMKVTEEYKSSNMVVYFEGLSTSCLMNINGQKGVPNHVLLFVVGSKTTLQLNTSGLLANHIVELFNKRPLLGHRPWSRAPFIKHCLSEFYHLSSQADNAVSLVFDCINSNIAYVLQPAIDLRGEHYFVAEIRTMQGRVYLLAPSREELEQACQFIWKCIDVGRRFKSYLSLWGYHVLRLSRGEFCLIYKSHYKISASLYLNITETHCQPFRDLRAHEIAKHFEKPGDPPSKPDHSEVAQPEAISVDFELPMNTSKTSINSNESAKQIIGHVIHTHIIKYECSMPPENVKYGTCPKLDESVFTNLSSEVLESLTFPAKQVSLPPQDKVTQLIEKSRPLETSFLGNFSIVHEDMSSTDPSKINKKKNKIKNEPRKPINHMDPSPVLVDCKPQGWPRVEGEVPCNLLQQLSPSRLNRAPVPNEAHNQPVKFKCLGGKKGQVDAAHHAPDAPKKEIESSSNWSKVQNPSFDTLSNKKSSTKPRVPSHPFKEDDQNQTACNNSKFTPVDSIRDFSRVAEESCLAPWQLTVRSQKSKLKTSASCFNMPPPQELILEKLKESKKAAEDYFAGC